MFGSFLNIDGLTNSVARTAMLVYKKCTYDDQMTLNLHHLVNDSDECVQGIGPAGIIDPVETMGILIYRLTHRMTGTHDIANDLDLVIKTREVYKPLEESSLFDIWFPLLPTPSKLRRLWGYSRLHWMIQGFVAERRRTGRVEQDAMQLMMEQKISDPIITLVRVDPSCARHILTSDILLMYSRSLAESSPVSLTRASTLHGTCATWLRAQPGWRN